MSKKADLMMSMISMVSGITSEKQILEDFTLKLRKYVDSDMKSEPPLMELMILGNKWSDKQESKSTESDEPEEIQKIRKMIEKEFGGKVDVEVIRMTPDKKQ